MEAKIPIEVTKILHSLLTAKKIRILGIDVCAARDQQPEGAWLVGVWGLGPVAFGGRSQSRGRISTLATFCTIRWFKEP